MTDDDHRLAGMRRHDPLEGSGRPGDHLVSELSIAYSLCQILLDDPGSQDFRCVSVNRRIARAFVLADADFVQIGQLGDVDVTIGRQGCRGLLCA